MSDAPTWMTRPEAAAYARMSLSTFDRWRRGPDGPRTYRAGGALRFKRADLDAAMKPEDPAPDTEAELVAA